jgi:predicted nucleotidyltransferase
VIFGSASRGQPDARDLDIAVGSRAQTGLDVIVVISALMEYRPGEFARQQMKASGQRLSTEWMRRLDLALMAGRP